MRHHDRSCGNSFGNPIPSSYQSGMNSPASPACPALFAGRRHPLRNTFVAFGFQAFPLQANGL